MFVGEELAGREEGVGLLSNDPFSLRSIIHFEPWVDWTESPSPKVPPSHQTEHHLPPYLICTGGTGIKVHWLTSCP
jgi:hypothetical protein